MERICPLAVLSPSETGLFVLSLGVNPVRVLNALFLVGTPTKVSRHPHQEFLVISGLSTKLIK